ncbi:MAG: S-layer homology domain-containing protein [Deltaproteobacteria bacterium]
MFKKVISITLILMFLFVQLIPVSVLAGGTDAKDIFERLNGLTTAVKGQVLKYLWDDVVEELVNGTSVDVETVYNTLQEDITAVSATTGISWDDIISNSSTLGDHKISSDTLKAVIEKLINNKSTIVYYYGFYSEYANRDIFKQWLFGDVYASKSAGDVYVALLPYTVPILTSNQSGAFIRNGDVSSALAAKLGVKTDVFNLLVTDLNGKVDTLAGKINNDLDLYEGISKTDIINILNISSEYPLYRAPSGGTGSTGGGSTTESTTPTTTPVNVVNEVINGTASIINETDPNKAMEQAQSLISNTVDDIKKLQDEGLSIDTVANALANAANTVLEKVNTQTVVPTVSADTAAVVIDTSTASELIAKLDTIVNTVTTLNNELVKASADTKIESVLLIKVNTADTSINTASVQLPPSLLSAASEKNIDKIAIDTGIAKIALAPDSITGNDKGAVTLSASKVDTTALTEEQRAIIGSNNVFEFKASAGEKTISNFSKPVEITIPYTLKEGENPALITVFYLNDKGKLENVIGTYNEASKLVVFNTKHFSKYIIKENKIVFNDLDKYGWAKDSIEAMAAKGIIVGMEAGKYEPAGKLTRAQFAALIVRAYKLEDASAKNVFSDVKATDWYYSVVCSAYKAGIVKGISVDKFAPDKSVTRQEMASMIARVLVSVKDKDISADTGMYLKNFTDKGLLQSYAVNSANLVSKYGIISGKPGNVFDPNGITTRAEAASVIQRMFNVK